VVKDSNKNGSRDVANQNAAHHIQGGSFPMSLRTEEKRDKDEKDQGYVGQGH
jgi:hypothetical protein